MFKKIHMIGLKDSEYSGDKVQDDITTTKSLVKCAMLVNTIVHPGFWSLLYSSGTDTMLNGYTVSKISVTKVL